MGVTWMSQNEWTADNSVDTGKTASFWKMTHSIIPILLGHGGKQVSWMEIVEKVRYHAGKGENKYYILKIPF